MVSFVPALSKDLASARSFALFRAQALLFAGLGGFDAEDAADFAAMRGFWVVCL